MALRSLSRPSQHPTGEQAAVSLRRGLCLYAAVSVCSGPAGSVGLAREDDTDAVLVCKAHSVDCGGWTSSSWRACAGTCTGRSTEVLPRMEKAER